MTFVDTNILVDLMLGDEAVLEATEALINQAKQPLVITDAVVGETCSLLENNPRFGLPRADVYAGMRLILARKEFLAGGKSGEALEVYAKQPRLDIIDCLLACYAGGRQAGLLTRDKNLQKILVA